MSSRNPAGRSADDALLSMAFSVHSNPGAYALLLGAGVSAPTVPTAWQVLEDLCRKTAQVVGEDPGEEPTEWYHQKYREPADYSSIIERVTGSPDERQRLLQGYFEATAQDVEEGLKQPTAAHRSIARLVAAGSIRVILTLNFDRLLEHALRDEGIEPTVASTRSDFAGLAPLHTLKCCVIHLHGDFKNPASMRNTSVELEGYDDATQLLLRRVLEDYGLIVAGWSSAYDSALRDAISAHYPSRYTMTWIEPGTLPEVGEDLQLRKQAVLLPLDADAAFGRLADAVDALTDTGAPHPLTVPVAVASAKRQLAGRHVAIPLHDSLATAIANLHDIPDLNLPEYQDDQPYGGYAAMARRIERAARLPAALIATLAYWGDDRSDDWWLSELERFAAQQRQSGLSSLLELRKIAGLHLYYAAGVGATAGNCFRTLGRILELKRDDPYSAGRQPLSEVYEPSTVYAYLPSRQHSWYANASPLLLESLGTGPLALEEAWQTFEIIRMTSRLMTNANFAESYGKFHEAQLHMEAATAHRQRLQKLGIEVSSELAAEMSAEQDRDKAGQELVGLVRPRRVHVLLTDVGFSPDSFRSPVAERAASAVQTSPDHAWIESGLFPAAGLSEALKAVSASLGGLGGELTWQHVPVGGMGGIVPSTLWLDDGAVID